MNRGGETLERQVLAVYNELCGSLVPAVRGADLLIAVDQEIKRTWRGNRSASLKIIRSVQWKTMRSVCNREMS